MDNDRELVVRAEEIEPLVEPRRSVVRFNAVSHGITSVAPVLPGVEDEREWKRFQAEILESLGPADVLQLTLADLVAGDLWRMMRVARFERESIITEMQRIRDDIASSRRHSAPLRAPQNERNMEGSFETASPPQDADDQAALRDAAPLHSAAPQDERDYLTWELVERIEEMAMARLLPKGKDMEVVLRHRAQLQKQIRDNVEMIRVLQGKGEVRKRRRRLRG